MKPFVLTHLTREISHDGEAIFVQLYNPEDDTTIGYRQRIRLGGSVQKLQDDLRHLADALEAFKFKK